MVTVQDYINDNPTLTETRKDLLHTFEDIIFSKGYEWLHVPQNAWIDIFSSVKRRSPEALVYADFTLHWFYNWLRENGYTANPPYPRMDFSSLFASEIEKIYPPSLSVLLEWNEAASENSTRSTPYTKLVNQGFLVLLWGGFAIEDLISISTTEVAFLNGEYRIQAPTSMLDFSIVQIRDKKFTSSKANRILFELWRYSINQAVEQNISPLPLCLTEKNAPFSYTTAQIRLRRCCEKINKKFDTKINATHIKKAGLLEKAYHYWSLNHLPWRFSYSEALRYNEIMGEKPSVSISVLRAEFARFIEYVRFVQNEDI